MSSFLWWWWQLAFVPFHWLKYFYLSKGAIWMMHISKLVEPNWCKPDFKCSITFVKISFYKIKCSHSFTYDIINIEWKGQGKANITTRYGCWVTSYMLFINGINWNRTTHDLLIHCQNWKTRPTYSIPHPQIVDLYSNKYNERRDCTTTPYNYNHYFLFLS